MPVEKTKTPKTRPLPSRQEKTHHDSHCQDLYPGYGIIGSTCHKDNERPRQEPVHRMLYPATTRIIILMFLKILVVMLLIVHFPEMIIVIMQHPVPLSCTPESSILPPLYNSIICTIKACRNAPGYGTKPAGSRARSAI